MSRRNVDVQRALRADAACTARALDFARILAIGERMEAPAEQAQGSLESRRIGCRDLPDRLEAKSPQALGRLRARTP
jgi:predicted protein tyrosine phosphatase